MRQYSRRRYGWFRRVLGLVALWTLTLAAPSSVGAQGRQNPSPMTDQTRRHYRILRGEDPGLRFTIDSILPTPVEIFVPARLLGTAAAPLLIHFMGSTWLPPRAVAAMPDPVMVAAVHLGGGFASNARPFVTDSLRFQSMVAAIRQRLERESEAPRISAVHLSAWSAGTGAVRAIVDAPANVALLSGVLILDGCHTSYLPEGRPLADGGVLDTTGLLPFLTLARRAEAGTLRFVMTHSEVFPGTYASTTECADWLVERLALRRTPELEWGPMGMQLLSRTRSGGFEVLGFAGNSAPDHLDHLHGLAGVVPLLLRSH
ncbi:MAG: hypothetical protein ACKOCN_00270 [Planctomycetaceae bacterium]